MTTRTTIHLQRLRLRDWLRMHERPIVSTLMIGMLGSVLLLIYALLGQPQSTHQASAVPTPVLPIATSAPVYIIATARPAAPTPTPDTRVMEELAALRAQVAQLQAAQEAAVPPAPQIVYQVVSAPEQAAPTVDAAQYQVDNAAPTMAPQTAAILDRNAWAAQAQEHRGQP